ncbi:protein kinase [candidate division KSB1 bacterium]
MIGTTIAHYKILEKLGEGGMGVVYKAEDTKLKREVAIKFLPSQVVSDDTARSRFMVEAQAAAALNHNNIATIYSIEEVDSDTFIVMEYVKGQNLKDKIDSGSIEINEALDIVIQIAEGLLKAHEKGIVHRDIKPANIVIADDGTAKILDFGLAKAVDVSITKTGTTLGTAAYMSPEQYKDEVVDHRTDIWALGVVLYEMLEEKRPFKGEYESAMMYSIVNTDPEPMTNVPDDLLKIILKTLDKSPDDRYQTANDLMNDLKNINIEPEVDIATNMKKKPSIAVLPFANMSADPEQEYFCDGMAEEIINALTNIENLRVVARTSAFAFKGMNIDINEIGQKLRAETILEGSVRKAGNRLRITAQLIKVEDGYHLWSERYDRDMADIFAIQDEISLAIVDKLKVKLIGDEQKKIEKKGTENIDAYNLYLQGAHQALLFTKEGWYKSIEYFNKALEIDPNYALAYSGIAMSYRWLGTAHGYLPPKEALPRAREFVEKALSIDENLAEAHLILAEIHRDYDLDLIKAEQEYMLAIELKPGYADPHSFCNLTLGMTDRYEQAFEHNRIARELDPVNWLHWFIGGWIYYCDRQFDQAIRLWQKSDELFPNSPLILSHGGHFYADMELNEKAISTAHKAEKSDIESPWHLGVVAYTYFKAGEIAEAKRIREKLEQRTDEPGTVGAMVLIYSAFGEIDLAIEWLERAFDERSMILLCLNAPLFDNIRDHETFKEILRKMGINT